MIFRMGREDMINEGDAHEDGQQYIQPENLDCDGRLPNDLVVSVSWMLCPLILLLQDEPDNPDYDHIRHEVPRKERRKVGATCSCRFRYRYAQLRELQRIQELGFQWKLSQT